MEIINYWLIIIFIISLSVYFALIKPLLSLIQHSSSNKAKLPPGPLTIPIISDIKLFLKLKDPSNIEPLIHKLALKYGPIFNLKIALHNIVFITKHDLAHKALIQHGPIFADRPPMNEVHNLMTSNRHNIHSATYGPLWRAFRRNISSGILHQSRFKSYNTARKWALDVLKKRLNKEAQLGQCHVQVMKHFKYTMFCLLAYMCFGDKFDEKVIGDIEDMERNIILSLSKFNLLGAFPKLTKMLMPKRWEELHELINNQERVFVPLIRARKEKQRRSDDVVAYVDTLLNLSVPSEEGGVRKLSEKEIATLCTEFFNAAADTTSTTMEWIMANLVRYPKIQEKLYSEIQGVVSSRDGGDEDEGDEIKDEELHKMKYLKAVVLEGLRRHPPAHVGIPHAVEDDVILEGHLVPRDAIIIFTIAEMGWDPTVWEDPMEFKPERFLVSEMGGLDITGTREIKMMPFGAGRRICPGLSFGMQLLEYLVANLVKDFKWTARMGDGVDLSEKIELTSIMKHPLCAHVSSRRA